MRLQSLAWWFSPQEPQICLYRQTGPGAEQRPWFHETQSCDPSGSFDGKGFGEGSWLFLMGGQCWEGEAKGARAQVVEVWSGSWQREQSGRAGGCCLAAAEGRRELRLDLARTSR